MKKLLFLFAVPTIVGIFTSTLCVGQANTAGTIHAGLGWGLTLGGAKINTSFTWPAPLTGTYEQTDRGIGANSNYGVSFGYGVADMFSAGLYLRKEGAGYLVTDDSSSSSTTIGTSNIGVGLQGKLYAVNKDRFTLHFTPSIGFSTGKARNYDDYYEETGKNSGLNYGFAVGLGWYWADFIGMYFDMGYNGSSLKVTEWEYNGTSTTSGFSDYKMQIKQGGFYIGLGLAAKFGGK